MEPIKGETLAQVPEEAERLFREHSDLSVPSWAIRFAASHENVFMVLGGMSNLEQLTDNTGYIKDFVPFGDEEFAIAEKAV